MKVILKNQETIEVHGTVDFVGTSYIEFHNKQFKLIRLNCSEVEKIVS